MTPRGQPRGAYRERMAELAVLGSVDVWHQRVDVATVQAIARQAHANDLKRQLTDLSGKVVPGVGISGTRSLLTVGGQESPGQGGERMPTVTTTG